MERNEEDGEREEAGAGGASIYSQPELYAHAFGGFRDFPKEVAFLHKLYQSREGGGGKNMRTLLELGCGPAWHSIEHAKKILREEQNSGDSGDGGAIPMSESNEKIVSVALDVNQEMVSYAIERASEERAVLDVVDVVLGDMRDLSTHLPEKYLKPGGYFDCTTLLLGTAAHLLTHDDLVRTFREAFACLREDGIFVVEVEHPMTTLFSGDLKFQDGEENSWEVTLGKTGRSSEDSSDSSSKNEEDGSEKEETMRIVWGDPENDFFDATNQVLHRTVSVQKYYTSSTNTTDDDDDDNDDDGPTSMFVQDPHYESKEVVKCKLFTLPELIAVASSVGFRFIQSFGDLDDDVKFDSENAQNMVAAFRKEG